MKQKFSYFINIDVYCQGVQLMGDDKNLNDYEIENEDNLVIIPKVKLPAESFMTTSAGKIFQQEKKNKSLL
jgi:hypothetical protein